jgi:hypothetical protein
VPVFNLVGQSMFTEVRRHGSVAINLGPSIADGIKADALPSLKQELELIGRKIDIGQNPEILCHRLERVLVNTGMPEEMSSGEKLLSRECAASSRDIIQLGEAIRKGNTRLSPRAENLLGNLKWMGNPVFSGIKFVDSQVRAKKLSIESSAILEHYDCAIASDPNYLAPMKNRALLLHAACRDRECMMHAN